ncbi:MAG: UDP-glucose 4-epimerase GalE [Verrucomicrobiota bacterium]|nr:UDP-glucose 4-epimerase GalE [Verrucomicrobiota bacterium]
MKALVTGGAGYIGSVTTELLLDSGHDVIVFDNLERGHRAAVDRRARFVKGDLRDRKKIAAVMAREKPDAVMHFAAYALVGESMDKPETYFGNNLVGGVNLAEAMLAAGVGKIVFSSTCATYGQPQRTPITEDEPQRPINPYGESKLLLEKALDWYRRIRGMQTVFLRYFNACGATKRFGEDHDPETHLIPIVLQAALGKRDRVTIFGEDYDTPDGTCLRDYIHIVDLAQAHILALTSAVSGAFNLGNGNGYSVKEVIETARQVTGHPIPAAAGPRRPGDPARLLAAADKARTELGWKPKHPDLRAIIESAWAWHRAHPDGYADKRPERNG